MARKAVADGVELSGNLKITGQEEEVSHSFSAATLFLLYRYLVNWFYEIFNIDSFFSLELLDCYFRNIRPVSLQNQIAGSDDRGKFFLGECGVPLSNPSLDVKRLRARWVLDITGSIAY